LGKERLHLELVAERHRVAGYHLQLGHAWKLPGSALRAGVSK
jgi:hypothetical protein